MKNIELNLGKIVRYEILKEASPTHIFDIIKDLHKTSNIEKRIDSWYIADGAVGLFRGTDGNAYEIVVRPAKMGQFKKLFSKYLEKKR